MKSAAGAGDEPMETLGEVGCSAKFLECEVHPVIPVVVGIRGVVYLLFFRIGTA